MHFAKEYLTQIFVITIWWFIIDNVKVVGAACKSFCNIPSPWIVQEKHVCYEAKGRKPATLTFKQDCQLYALRLQHISGLLSCYNIRNDHFSRWGCNNIRRDRLHLVISNPKTNKLWYPESISDEYYLLHGFKNEDDAIVIKKRGNFTVGDTLKFWYSQDWFSKSWEDNEGRHCISIDISCFV